MGALEVGSRCRELPPACQPARPVFPPPPVGWLPVGEDQEGDGEGGDEQDHAAGRRLGAACVPASDVPRLNTPAAPPGSQDCSAAGGRIV